MSLRNPERGDLRRVRPPAGIAPREWLRLSALFIAAVATTVGVLAGVDRWTGGALNARASGGASARPATEAPPAGITVVERLPAWDPPLALLDSLVRETTPADRSREYPEALAALAGAIAACPPRVLRQAAMLSAEDVTPRDLVRDPRRLRARPVSFTARVESVDGVAVRIATSRPGDVPALVICTDGTAGAVGLVGAEVRVTGAFYRACDIPAAGVPVTAALLLARDVVPTLDWPAVPSLPRGLAAGVEDSRPDEQPRPVCDDVFITVAAHVFDQPWAAVRASSTAGGPASEAPPAMTARAADADAAAWRLRPVRVDGRLLWSRFERFLRRGVAVDVWPTEGPSGWFAVLIERAVAGPCLVALRDAPAAEPGDLVEVDGLFLRIAAVENQSDDDGDGAHGFTRAPLVIASGNVRVRPAAVSRDGVAWGGGMVAVVITAAVVLVACAMRARRRAAAGGTGT